MGETGKGKTREREKERRGREKTRNIFKWRTEEIERKREKEEERKRGREEERKRGREEERRAQRFGSRVTEREVQDQHFACSPLYSDALSEKLVESWHVGADASTEVPVGRNFECRQRWRVSVRGRKKRAKTTTAPQDGKDKSTAESGAKGSERRRTNLQVILNTQKDSENEQQSDVDMVGADAGKNGAAATSGILVARSLQAS